VLPGVVLFSSTRRLSFFIQPKVGVGATASVLLNDPPELRLKLTGENYRICQFNQVTQVLKMAYHTTQSSRSLLFLLVASAGALLGACSWIPKGEAQFDVGMKDRGVASWYGEQFHGKQAANGEIFDMEGLTAAHRTMPLGSMVRVVNLSNGKHLHVRITDRGPYVNGRILDLSRAAAAQLGMERGGLAIVQVEIVGERRPEQLLSSNAEPNRGSPYILGFSALPEEEAPIMTAPLRALPSDLWMARRIRRVSAMLAADHTAHTEVAALALS
jgi:peptidoglycan lytic transglycosylase